MEPEDRPVTGPAGTIFLDRDGVINEDREDFVRCPDDWVPIDGSLRAIARLNEAGWRVVVVSNQSGLARRFFDYEALDAIHAKMTRALAAVGGAVDAIHFCPHRPEDDCLCRKPRPGLVREAEEQLGRANGLRVLIGDRGSDLEAARASGCLPVLVRTGRGEEFLEQGRRMGAQIFRDLQSAVEALLAIDQRAEPRKGTHTKRSGA